MKATVRIVIYLSILATSVVHAENQKTRGKEEQPSVHDAARAPGAENFIPERYTCVLRVTAHGKTREFSQSGELGEGCQTVTRKVRNRDDAKFFAAYGEPNPGLAFTQPKEPVAEGAVYCHKEVFTNACQ